MKDRVTSFLAFADPTLTFSDAPDFTIGWYAGNQEWDPLQDIARVVRDAQKHTGAQHVMFLGGSAGGLAALRISAEFPGSAALATDPQTDVAKYYPGHRNRLFNACWPAWEQEEALRSFPERFNMPWFYANNDPDNFIYYRQSTSDEFHERRHARPFQDSLADTTGMRQGHYRFVYERGEREGHGKITAAEFDRHIDAAVAFWRAAR